MELPRKKKIIDFWGVYERIDEMEEWVIFLEEVLPDFSLSLNDKQMKDFAKAIKQNNDCLLEMDFMSRGGGKKSEPNWKELYEIEKKKNDDLEKIIDTAYSEIAKKTNSDIKGIEISKQGVKYNQTFY